MKITFGALVKLPSPSFIDDEFEVVVEADILPGDAGGLHCPPSGPIPEILTVIIDPAADVQGTEYEHGIDVFNLLGEKDVMELEDQALLRCQEEEIRISEDADDRDPWEDEVEAEEIALINEDLDSNEAA